MKLEFLHRFVPAETADSRLRSAGARISPYPPRRIEFPTIVRVKGKGNRYKATGRWISWDELRAKNPLAISEPPSLAAFEKKGGKVGEGKKLKPGEWLTEEKLGIAKGTTKTASGSLSGRVNGSSQSIYADPAVPSEVSTATVNSSGGSEAGSDVQAATTSSRKKQRSLLERFTSEVGSPEQRAQSLATQPTPATPARSRKADLSIDVTKKPFVLPLVSPSAARTPLSATHPLPETPLKHTNHQPSTPSQNHPPLSSLAERRCRPNVPPLSPATPESQRHGADASAPRGLGLGLGLTPTRPTTFGGPLSPIVQRAGLPSSRITASGLNKPDGGFSLPRRGSVPASHEASIAPPAESALGLQSPLRNAERTAVMEQQVDPSQAASLKAVSQIEDMLLKLRDTRNGLKSGSSASRWATPDPTPSRGGAGSKSGSQQSPSAVTIASQLSPSLVSGGNSSLEGGATSPFNINESGAAVLPQQTVEAPKPSSHTRGSTFREEFSVHEAVAASAPAPRPVDKAKSPALVSSSSEPPSEPKAMRKSSSSNGQRSTGKVTSDSLTAQSKGPCAPMQSMLSTEKNSRASEPTMGGREAFEPPQPSQNAAPPTPALGSGAFSPAPESPAEDGDDADQSLASRTSALSGLPMSTSSHIDWADDDEDDALPDLDDWGITLPPSDSTSSMSTAPVSSTTAGGMASSTVLGSKAEHQSSQGARVFPPPPWAKAAASAAGRPRELFPTGESQREGSHHETKTKASEPERRGKKVRDEAVRPPGPAEGDWKAAQAAHHAAEQEAEKNRAKHKKERLQKASPSSATFRTASGSSSGRLPPRDGEKLGNPVGIDAAVPRGLKIAGVANAAGKLSSPSSSAFSSNHSDGRNLKSPYAGHGARRPSASSSSSSVGDGKVGIRIAGRAASSSSSSEAGSKAAAAATSGLGAMPHRELASGTVHSMHAPLPNSGDMSSSRGKTTSSIGSDPPTGPRAQQETAKAAVNGIPRNGPTAATHHAGGGRGGKSKRGGNHNKGRASETGKAGVDVKL